MQRNVREPTPKPSLPVVLGAPDDPVVIRGRTVSSLTRREYLAVKTLLRFYPAGCTKGQLEREGIEQAKFEAPPRAGANANT